MFNQFCNTSETDPKTLCCVLHNPPVHKKTPSIQFVEQVDHNYYHYHSHYYQNYQQQQQQRQLQHQYEYCKSFHPTPNAPSLHHCHCSRSLKNYLQPAQHHYHCHMSDSRLIPSLIDIVPTLFYWLQNVTITVLTNIKLILIRIFFICFSPIGLNYLFDYGNSAINRCCKLCSTSTTVCAYCNNTIVQSTTNFLTNFGTYRNCCATTPLASHQQFPNEARTCLCGLLQNQHSQPLTTIESIQALILHLLELCRIAPLYRKCKVMRGRLRNMLRWRPTSSEELDDAERRCLSYLKCNYKTYYVDIGQGWNLDNVKIWTLEVPSNSHPNCFVDEGSKFDKNSNRKQSPLKNEQTQRKSLTEGLPIVMLHGFASGVGLWALNLDHFALFGNRHVYAIDLLGFGKSSRPNFTFPKTRGLTGLQQSKAEAEYMEKCLVESIEKWRHAIGSPLNEKFILLGHSFGAYLALAYALKYPDHIAHVILADPWGIPQEANQRNMSTQHYNNSRQLPFWLRALGKLFFEVFNPLAGLRAAGPWGPKLINTLRPDLKRKFERLTIGDTPLSESADLSETETSTVAEEDGCFLEYIYHCNAQPIPSGEIAFKKISTSTGWARLPMLERIIELEYPITLSFIYGSRSWIDRQSGFQAKYILATAASTMACGNNSSDELETDEEVERVDIHVLNGAGHHVYADKPDEFNELVLKICNGIDGQFVGTETNTMEQMEDDDSFQQQQKQINQTSHNTSESIDESAAYMPTTGSVSSSTFGPAAPGSPVMNNVKYVPVLHQKAAIIEE